MLSYFFWNPSSIAFVIPVVGLPVRWYSLFFAFGIYGAMLIVRSIITRRARIAGLIESHQQHVINSFVERLALYAFVGVILGARLGHVFFYEPRIYFNHPEEILKVWHGGLSSHGAVLGLLFSIWIFSKSSVREAFLPERRELLDIISIGSAFTAGCIRCGNFFNQEIVGLPTSVPWAIVFGSPQDCCGAIPRHPSQLYEALISFSLLGILLVCEKQRRLPGGGRTAGLYLIVTFTARMVLETFKASQCDFDTGLLRVGAVLSLPFLVLGALLTARVCAKRPEGQISRHNENS